MAVQCAFAGRLLYPQTSDILFNRGHRSNLFSSRKKAVPHGTALTDGMLPICYADNDRMAG